MRMFHIYIGGTYHSTVPAGANTAVELQHEIAQRSGALVRVVEFIKEDPPKREERWEGDEYAD